MATTTVKRGACWCILYVVKFRFLSSASVVHRVEVAQIPQMCLSVKLFMLCPLVLPQTVIREQWEGGLLSFAWQMEIKGPEYMDQSNTLQSWDLQN